MGKDHSVFNLMYLVEIFAEFYPEEFVVKRRKKGRIPEYSVKELLTFILWAKLNNIESSRKLEEWCNNNDESCQLVLNCKKPCKNNNNGILKIKMLNYLTNLTNFSLILQKNLNSLMEKFSMLMVPY